MSINPSHPVWSHTLRRRHDKHGVVAFVVARCDTDSPNTNGNNGVSWPPTRVYLCPRETLAVEAALNTTSCFYFHPIVAGLYAHLESFAMETQGGCGVAGVRGFPSGNSSFSFLIFLSFHPSTKHDLRQHRRSRIAFNKQPRHYIEPRRFNEIVRDDRKLAAGTRIDSWR